MWIQLHTTDSEGSCPTRRLTRPLDGERWSCEVPASGIVNVPEAVAEALVAEGVASEYTADGEPEDDDADAEPSDDE